MDCHVRKRNIMPISKVIKIIPLAGVLGISLLLNACNTVGGTTLNVTQGSGNVKTESRTISGVTAVQLKTSGELSLSQGESESLTIEAEDNLLPLLTSDVSNGTLTLGIKPGSGLSATRPMKYTLTVKNLSSIVLDASGSITAADLTVPEKLSITNDGSGSITMAALSASSTTIHLSGSGGLNITNLTSDSLVIQIDGSGSAQIGGTVSDQTATLNASGDYHADTLTSKTAVVKTTGSGSATVQVSDTLDAAVSGSGSITYSGSPTLTQKDTGSGQITQK